MENLEKQRIVQNKNSNLFTFRSKILSHEKNRTTFYCRFRTNCT